MTEREGTEQPQRYCPNCGAEVRLGDAFCASCGEPLGTRDSGPVAHEAAPGEPGGGSESVDDTQDQAVSSTDDQPGWMGSDEGNWSEDPQNRIRWFKELPMVSKALIVGLVILVALPLLVLLSPLALVVAMVLFGVSLIAVIMRAVQHRSVKGWGIVAVASLTFIVVAGYFSIVVYGSLFNSSASRTGSGSNKNATKQASADEKNTQALREAAFRQPPLGVIDQKYIDDVRVAGDTATVKFVGMVERGDEFMAVAERVQGKQTCSSMASVVAKNDIPVDTIEVISSRGEELARCEVKRFTTTGKNKQK